MKNLSLFFFFLLFPLTVLAQTPLLLPIYEGEDTIVFYDEEFKQAFEVKTFKIMAGAFEQDHVFCSTKHGLILYDKEGNILYQKKLVDEIKASRDNNLYCLFENSIEAKGSFRPHYETYNGVWIDKYGKRHPQLDTFLYSSIFSEGLAIYRNSNEDKNIGVINEKGEKIIAPMSRSYRYAYYYWGGPYFSEGLYPFLISSERDSMSAIRIYIDTLGNEICSIPQDLMNFTPFFNGRAKVMKSNNHYMGMSGSLSTSEKIGYGFINKKGKLAIKTNYSYATDFKEGISIVEINHIDSSGKFGGIDTLGNTIIPFEYKEIKRFNFGMAAAIPRGKKHSIIINKKNEVLYESTTQSILQPVGEHIIMEDIEAGKVYRRYINLKTGAVLQSNYSLQNPLPID